MSFSPVYRALQQDLYGTIAARHIETERLQALSRRQAQCLELKRVDQDIQCDLQECCLQEYDLIERQEYRKRMMLERRLLSMHAGNEYDRQAAGAHVAPSQPTQSLWQEKKRWKNQHRCYSKADQRHVAINDKLTSGETTAPCLLSMSAPPTNRRPEKMSENKKLLTFSPLDCADVARPSPHGMSGLLADEKKYLRSNGIAVRAREVALRLANLCKSEDRSRFKHATDSLRQ
jgi:hypothetical protein